MSYTCLFLVVDYHLLAFTTDIEQDFPQKFRKTSKNMIFDDLFEFYPRLAVLDPQCYPVGPNWPYFLKAHVFAYILNEYLKLNI